MQKLAAESGKSFDPKVVDVLQKRYQHLERLAVAKSAAGSERAALHCDQDRARPGTGSRIRERARRKITLGRETTFLSSIAAARQEAQSLFELSQDLGASLSLTETLSVFSVKLKPMVPYDAIAIYIKREDELVPEYVNGDNYRLFSSLRIPIGQGLSGWVAHNRKPIINGNPSVEPGYLNDPSKFSTLALGAGRAAGGRCRSDRRARALPRRTRRLHLRSPAHSAGGQRQDGAVDRERAQVPAGRKFRDHRLPDRPAQCALAVPATGSRTGALQARQSRR